MITQEARDYFEKHSGVLPNTVPEYTLWHKENKKRLGKSARLEVCHEILSWHLDQNESHEPAHKEYFEKFKVNLPW